MLPKIDLEIDEYSLNGATNGAKDQTMSKALQLTIAKRDF
jgi:hypothetical protein